MLLESSVPALATFAHKIKGELKYHVLHAETWMKTLGKGTEESHARMQQALQEVYPMALAIFEPGLEEQELIEAKIFGGEAALQQRWEDRVKPFLTASGLQCPEVKDPARFAGGRRGFHTEYLQPLLTEMSEVIRSEPGASW